MASIFPGLCDGHEDYTLFPKLKLGMIATTMDGMKLHEVRDEKALEEWLALTFVVSSASDDEKLSQSVETIK
ncbi:hypothetical protein F4779DRAFT_618586 [Xylariaceae sp. FL0662B]|nr:hypothetical protein F4779DRAFT_618586 [Xylariaceae sp. FL0662B]